MSARTWQAWQDVATGRAAFTACAAGLLVAFVTAITGGTGASGAADPQDGARPNNPASCTTSGCHAGVIAHDHIHGPLNVGACAVCHVLVDEAAHRFAPRATGTDQCTGCHDTGHGDADAVDVHGADLDGACTACHDPHGGATKALLRMAAPGELCRDCHDTGTEFAPAQHHANGDCLACHGGHPGGHASLLRAEGAALCNRCHDATLGLDAPGTAQVHGPVAVACLPCHDPHGTPQPALLRQEPAALCLGCHADTVSEGNAVPHGHAVTSVRACLECHEAHRADHEFLLQAPEVDLCLQCHARSVARSDGTIVPGVTGVAALADAGTHTHAALDAGCSGCHDAHADFGALLLRGDYPTVLYAAFDQGAYGLCFGCHEQDAFLGADASARTAFRDGHRNLHFVHVGAQGNRGRSCRFCHTAHASASPKLMRDEVPFGDWAIPIRFESTATGGSCAAGCHAARSYDRGAE